MTRNLLYGAIGLATAYVIGKQVVAASRDLARYDRLRAMSNEKPLAAEIGEIAFKPFVDFFASDIVRYAKMKAM